jgi:hypothetical protein
MQISQQQNGFDWSIVNWGQTRFSADPNCSPQGHTEKKKCRRG